MFYDGDTPISAWGLQDYTRWLLAGMYWQGWNPRYLLYHFSHTLCPGYINVLFLSLWATSGDTQCIFLALYLGITPRSAQGPCEVPGTENPTGLVTCKDQCLTHCSIIPTPVL